MEKQISKVIEKYYDIGTVFEVTEILGGYNNRGFCIQTYKDTVCHTYFVCQYKAGVTYQEVEFEHALITHVIEKGMLLCAGVVAARNGKTLVQVADNGNLVSVYAYLDGEDRYSWTNNHLTDTEFNNAAGVLAEFHNAVCDFNPTHLKRDEPPIMELLPTIVHTFKQVGKDLTAGKFQTYFSANLGDILKAIENHCPTPSEIAGLPIIATHYDFHPGNLKWKNEAVTGLFDFDWSKMDLRLFDVSMALVYFCGQWDGEHQGALHLEKVVLFLAGYHFRLKHLEGQAPLSPREQQLLPKMLVIANIYLLFWEVSRYCDTKEADENEYLRYLKHNIQLMRWLEINQKMIANAVAQAIG